LVGLGIAVQVSDAAGGGARLANVARQATAFGGIVNVPLVPLAGHVEPLQPTNVEPGLGVADRVTVLPAP